MRTFSSADDITAAVGEELGVSDWVTVTQERVNQFAEATGDHQWIHVDPERATRESPFGGPIAHGYLSLSLLPMLGWQIYTVANAKLGINYGSNKVRFPAPVPVGSRVRLRSSLQSADVLGDGSIQMVVKQTLGSRTTPSLPSSPKPSLAWASSRVGSTPPAARSRHALRVGRSHREPCRARATPSARSGRTASIRPPGTDDETTGNGRARPS